MTERNVREKGEHLTDEKWSRMKILGKRKNNEKKEGRNKGKKR